MTRPVSEAENSRPFFPDGASAYRGIHHAIRQTTPDASSTASVLVSALPVAGPGPPHRNPDKTMKTKQTKLLLLASLCSAALVSTAIAQTAVETTQPQSDTTREFTIGGSGSSNTDLDDSFGSLDFSYGMFTSPRSEWLLRQSASYSNPDNGDNGWVGSTRLAYDWHFSEDTTTRPFLGVNAGRLYGNNVQDTWTAGLEGGAKIFMKSQTFVYALVSYDWLFDQGNQIDDRFDDGRLNWSLGVGYQF